MKTLLIDNYDSFTYNLFQLLAEVNGEEPLVVRNDEARWAELSERDFDNVVISPGPGRPERIGDFGVCADAIREAKVPLLGVCIGHQGLGTLHGAAVVPAPEPVHGRLSAVLHDDSPLFAGIPREFQAVRYHSLAVEQPLPDELRGQTALLILELAPSHDGIVICSAHHDAIATALSVASEGDKPVITLATDIRGGGRHIYVGPDNWKAGRLAGNLMGRLLGKDGGEVLVIAGMLSMMGHEEREMGFRSVLRERHPRCHVNEVLQSLEQGERAGDLVFQALKRSPEIRGIYNASTGAQPIVDVLNALGKREDIVFITHELTEGRRKLLREGMIDVIIDQNPALEVRTAIETLAAQFARLDDPPASTITPVQIHTIENC